MDIATLIGIILGIGLMLFGIMSGDDGAAALMNFWDPTSVLITFGGAFAATLASGSIKDFVGGLKSITKAFTLQVVEEEKTITEILNLANVARKEGLLSLEEAANGLEDEFLKKGIMFVVD